MGRESKLSWTGAAVRPVDGAERLSPTIGGANAVERAGAWSAKRLQLINLPPQTRGSHACSVILALHGDVIAQNLRCVACSVDAEGAHQLRVSLRRLRVAMRAFKALLNSSIRRSVVSRARQLGAIVSELRDADVIIDERLAPKMSSADAFVLTQLNAWRDQVRGRVRARLSSANALTFTQKLCRAAARGTLLATPPDETTVTQAVAPFMRQTWEDAAPLAWKMTRLTHSGLHDLRKHTKTLRYGAELAAAGGRVDTKVIDRLKRLQDLLGFVNDTHLLENFCPPIGPAGARLRAICEQLVSEQRSTSSEKLTVAAEEWRELSRDWPW